MDEIYKKKRGAGRPFVKNDPSTYVRGAMMMMPKEIKQDIEVSDSQERVAEVDWDVITGSKAG